MRVTNKAIIGVLSLLPFLVPGAAFAVDGVIEINQARAEAGGVTAGDDPGFPVTINTPGSYRLTSNLRLPSGESVTAIDTLEATNVTIDLNGFSILGNDSSNIGIDGVNEWTVKNGTIDNMSVGISLASDARVENVDVLSSRGNGIEVGNNSRVTNSRIQNSGGDGVVALRDVLIADNVIAFNAQDGVQAEAGALIRGNEIVTNSIDGIRLLNISDQTGIDSSAHVTDNIIRGNNSNGINGTGFDTAIKVTGNTVANNDIGIGVRRGSIVSKNIVNTNGSVGISIFGSGLVIGNSIRGSQTCLRNAAPTPALGVVGYKENYLSGCINDTVDGNVTEIGENICGNDTTCP